MSAAFLVPEVMEQIQECVPTGMGGKKKEGRKEINFLHIVIIMTFNLILNVMTTVFGPCTAMLLIRMETVLLINFLFERVYLISLYCLNLNTYMQAGD